MKELKHLKALGRKKIFKTKKEKYKHRYKCAKIARRLAKAKTNIEKKAIWKVFLAA